MSRTRESMTVPSLDWRITLEEETAGVWAALATDPAVWASKTDRTGREPRAGRIESDVDVTWTIRHRTDVNSRLRVNDGARIYAIRGVQEIGRRLYLDLHSEIVVGGATAYGTVVLSGPDPVDPRPIDPITKLPIGDPPANIELFSGACYIDDRGEAIARMQRGETDIQGDAILKIAADDSVLIVDTETTEVTLTWRGRTRDAFIIRPEYHESWIHLLVSWHTRTATA